MQWPDTFKVLRFARLNTRVGDKVRFQIADVFLPSPGAVFAAVPTDTQLEGTIVGFSDSGLKTRFFAVVEVVRVQSLVVPLEKLEPLDDSTAKNHFD